MKKYSIPTLALVLGMIAVNAHGVSAESLGVTPNANANIAGTGVTASTTTGVNPGAAKIAKIIKRSDASINARISSLNKFSARLAKYKHLTDAQRASLSASVQSSIDSMNTLKAKIDADTDLVTAKTDYVSIYKNYRIFEVVLPSERTIASTDKALATVNIYQTTLGTLQTRITTAKTAGKNVTAVQASLDDATAKLADAQTQGQALITAVTSLKVDGGDKSIQASNKTQLAAAITARKAMNADINAARKDIGSIRSGLRTLKA